MKMTLKFLISLALYVFLSYSCQKAEEDPMLIKAGNIIATYSSASKETYMGKMSAANKQFCVRIQVKYLKTKNYENYNSKNQCISSAL
jgi:hypothetical protein